jgi:hypothetical protein
MQIYACRHELSRGKWDVLEEVELLLEALECEVAAGPFVLDVELEGTCSAIAVTRMEVHDFFGGVVSCVSALAVEVLLDSDDGLLADASVVCAIGTKKDVDEDEELRSVADAILDE